MVRGTRKGEPHQSRRRTGWTAGRLIRLLTGPGAWLGRKSTIGEVGADLREGSAHYAFGGRLWPFDGAPLSAGYAPLAACYARCARTLRTRTNIFAM